jgi:hypothetical protein
MNKFVEKKWKTMINQRLDDAPALSLSLSIDVPIKRIENDWSLESQKRVPMYITRVFNKL